MTLRGQNDISRCNHLHGWRLFFLIRMLNDLLKGIIPGRWGHINPCERNKWNTLNEMTDRFLSEFWPHAHSYIWQTCSSNLLFFLITQKGRRFPFSVSVLSIHHVSNLLTNIMQRTWLWSITLSFSSSGWLQRFIVSILWNFLLNSNKIVFEL